MKNFTKLIGIIAMAAVIGFAFVSCDTPEEKAAKAAAAAAEQAAKAAEEAASGLLTALQGNDPAALQEALTAGGSAAIAALVSTSATPGGDFSYELKNFSDVGEGIIITKYSGAGGLVIIPAEIEGYPVIQIAAQAFLGAGQYDIAQGYNITGVVIPENVVLIGRRAFQYCANLETVILPETLTMIDNEAFRGCPKLHTVNLPAGIKIIDQSAFSGCENLYNLTITDSITTIDFRMDQDDEYGKTSSQFNGCQKLPLAIRQRLIDIGYTGDSDATF